MMVITFFLLLNRYIAKRADFKVSDSTKYLVLGHSQPECAFNDTLIANLVNISQSGEAYFYTYIKLVQILKTNPNIKTIFVEFTNNQLLENKDQWIWNDVSLNYRYPKYSPFMNFNESMVLVENNFSGFLNSAILSTRSNVNRVWNQNYHFVSTIGGYKYLDREYTVTEKSSNITSDEKMIAEIPSMKNIEYLQKIITYSKSHNVNVFLIRSPIYNHIDDTDIILNRVLQEEFPNVYFLDFVKFPLNNSYYADNLHLNYKGAEIFSRWFNDILNKGLLEKDNKKQMIETSIELLNIGNTSSLN